MLIFGIIQALFIGLIALYEFKYKSSAVFLWATLLIMFAVPHLIASIIGDADYSEKTIIRASLFAIVFCCLYISTRILLGRQILKKNRSFFYYGNIRKTIETQDIHDSFLVFFLGIIIFLHLFPVVRYAGGIKAMSWGSGRVYSAVKSYFNSRQITGVIYFALSGIVAYLWIKKKRFYAILAGLLFMFEVIISRDRAEVLPVLCAVIAIFVFKNKRISPKICIMGGIGAVSVIYLVYGLRVFRHYGDLNDFVANFQLADFIGRINTYIKTGNGELSNLRWFYHFIENNNEFNDFNKGHTYIRMLLVYIPTRFSLGLKPSDFAITMGAAMGDGPGGSIHPTLFGDCFANLYYFGVLLGVFWAMFANVADRITTKRSPFFAIILHTLFSGTYVIMARGSVYNPFVNVAYGIPLIVFAEYLSSHWHFKLFSKISLKKNRKLTGINT